MDASLGELVGASHRVAEVRVPAVDHDVVGFEQPCKRLYGLFGGVSGRHHDPDGARGRQLCGELLQRRHLGDRGVVVVADHVVAAVTQALGHVGAHASESHHPDLHRSLPLFQ